MQRAHLVVHQRNQGADDDGDALPRLLARNGGYLVAQRLAPAGGHEHQRITPHHDVFNDGLLRPPERAVAKNFLKNEVNRQNDCYIFSSC